MGDAMHGGITAAAIEQVLRDKLQPTQLQVLDESAAHAGHAGANGTGFGLSLIHISEPTRPY